MSERGSYEQGWHECELLRTVLDSAEDAIFVKDREHRFLLNNRAHQRLLGAASQQELLGKTNADIWGEDRAAPHHADDRRVLDHGEAVLGREEPIRLPSGEERWISTSKVPLRSSEGAVQGVVAISRDITDRRLAQERLRTVIENAPVVLFALDTEGNFTLSRGKGLHGVGLEPDEAVGRSIFELYGGEPRILQTARRALAGEEVAQTLTAAGRVFDVRYSPLRQASGALSGTIGVAVDVTEREALQAELSYERFYDALTGLPNRAMLLQRLREALLEPAGQADAQRGAVDSVGEGTVKRTVAIILLELEDFEVVRGSVADTEAESGADAGALVSEVAERLSGHTRPDDLVARTGEGEFVVLLESADQRTHGPAQSAAEEMLGTAQSVAQRILQAIREPFALPDNEERVYLGVSVGVALGQGPDKEPAELLAEAGAALSQARREGRTGPTLYEQGTTGLIRKRAELEGELRQAARRPEDQFFVLYQPYVDLHSNKIVGAEALLRWHHPRRGLIMPEEFVNAAEQTGTISQIGGWVIRQAAHQASCWQEVSRARGSCPFVVGVNVSARQLSDPGLPQTVRLALAEARLGPEALSLEVTESALASGDHDRSRAAAAIQEIRDTGVRLAIDDFGTGHSSLARLGSLRVDCLKIDRSFVAKLGHDPTAEAIVRAAVGLAGSLGLRVIAEGIETEQQWRRLREFGCTLGQGRLFYRPMTALDLGRLLAEVGVPSEDSS